MSLQARSLHISIMIHVVIISIYMIGNLFFASVEKTRVVNFSLHKSDEDESGRPKMKSEPVSRQVMKPAAKQESEFKPVLEKPLEDITRSEPVKAEAALPVKAGNLKNEISGGAAAGSDKGGAGSGQSSGFGISAENAKAVYLKEHFSYIRDKILRNVNYPPTAVRMGWQGKSTVTFLIYTDGSVGRITVLHSSGYKVLDENAVETVVNSAPFPKPPVEARLIIPIIYCLK